MGRKFATMADEVVLGAATEGGRGLGGVCMVVWETPMVLPNYRPLWECVDSSPQQWCSY